MNSADFNSPGYEFMRSYKCMESLYYKLVGLDYQQEFCSQYNCPPIHKYYFSAANKNKSEQRLVFACLCTWLIKDKCQMNFDIVPDEYQETDVVLSSIVEAVRLLTVSDDDPKASSINLPVGRLKQGFGPEVVWTMNILADRALELKLETKPNIGQIKVVYYSKQSSERPNETISCITVGKPFVGGGLTTRPLGSYQVDDASLLFDDSESNANNDLTTQRSLYYDAVEGFHINPENWSELGEQFRLVFESAYSREPDENEPLDELICGNWSDLLIAAINCHEDIRLLSNGFLINLREKSNRLKKQLQTITEKENSIKSSLSKQIDEFLCVWRELTNENNRNQNLTKQIHEKTDKFEEYSYTLETINHSIEERIVDLNDKGKLREIESAKDKLYRENINLRIQEGLLLGIYFKYKVTSLERD